MKLHYALAALAVAAMSFSCYAAGDSVNLMAGWQGNGRGSADIPTDFGWAATPELTTGKTPGWHVAYNSTDYENGYRDNLGLNGTNIRALVIVQTNSVISYKVQNINKGVYKFSVNAAYMNGENIAQTFDFNSSMDGKGVSYGKTTLNTPKWGKYVTGDCDVAIMKDMDAVYMCWTVGSTTDRRLSWGYSLVEYTAEEYASMYSTKKNEAAALLEDEAYINVTGGERTALASVANEATVEPSDYKQSVIDLVNAINTFKAAKAGYDGFVAMKDKAATEAVKALFEGANGQYMTPLNAALEVAPETADAAVVATTTLEAAVREAIMGKVLGAGEAIEVPGALMPADGVIPECWTKTWNGGSGEKGMRRNAGENPTVWNMFDGYYDTDNWGKTGWDYELSQVLDLPVGDYTLAVVARSAAAGHEFSMTIGGVSTLLQSAGNEGGPLGRGWGINKVEFTVTGAEQGDKNIESIAAEGEATYPVTLSVLTKVKTEEPNNNWFSFNNFKLVRNAAVPTGISAVEAEENAPAVYYNLNGVRMDGNNLTPGVYVVRRGAKAEKILVK